MNLSGFNAGQAAFSFGASVASSAPSAGFNFSVPISSMAKTTIATPFSLSTQPTQTTAFNLSMQPTTSSQPGGLFGTSSTSLPSAGFFNLGTMSSTALPSLSSGLTIGLNAFGFAATTTATATTSILSTALATTPGKVGLGGVNLAEPSQPNTSHSTTFNNENKSIKESPVEPLIANLVTDLTKYLKEQKNTRDNISHWSASSIGSVGNDVKIVSSSLHHLSAMMQSLSSDVHRLKAASKQDVTNAEIAQRTHSLSMSHQYENSLPMRYFEQLLMMFEERMMAYRHEILVIEEFIQHITDNHTLSPQEFCQIFKKLSLGFVELTAQIQTVHESIKELKSAYHKLRSQTVSDGKNIFASSTTECRTPLQILNENRTPSTIGPSIFSSGSPKATNLTSTPHYSSLFSTSSQFQTPTFAQNLSSGPRAPLFGNTTTTTSSSFFGSVNTSCGPASTGLFGNTSAGTGGLFGGANFNLSGSPLGGGSVFGNPAFGVSAQKSGGNKRGKNN